MAKRQISLPILLLAAACSAKSTAAPGAASTSAPMPNAEMEALYRARMDSARMKYSPADVKFMNGMIAHHAQAILMARLSPTHGASSQILTLSGRIINAQQDEIAVMQRWLRERNLPVPEPHVDEKSLAVHGTDHNMPGMLTPEQLKQLDAARGPEFDRLFLTFMIQHHKGAVSMVQELFAAHGGAQEDVAFKLASDVQIDQLTEIDRMEKMLAALKRN